MSDISRSDFELALDVIKRGDIIAAPTDTVYGILADATNESAIKKVYELKKRSPTKPLIVLVSSLKMARTMAIFSHEIEGILKFLWLEKKYPITVILKAKKTVSKLITAGGDTIALRLPNYQFCIDLIDNLGKPIVAPSANISGHNTAISYDDVRKNFGSKIPIIRLDKYNKKVSTIIEPNKCGITLIREGEILKSELEKYFCEIAAY